MSKKTRKKKRKSNQVSESTAKQRQIVLALLSVLICFLFFSFGSNRSWLTTRILPYLTAIPEQMGQMDMESRYLQRHGTLYQIVQYLQQQVPKGESIILPPQAYTLDQFYSLDNPQQIRDSYFGFSNDGMIGYLTQDYHFLDVTLPDSLLLNSRYAIVPTPQAQFVLQNFENEEDVRQYLSQVEKYTEFYEGNLSRNRIIEILQALTTQNTK